MKAGEPEWNRWLSPLLALVGIFLTLIALVVSWAFFAAPLGPKQHISFSHRVHVQDKNISCYMCHRQAQYSTRAGIPALGVCMVCHSQIIINHPEVQHVRGHFFDSTSTAWTQVTRLPEYVYFDHSAHLRRGIDCSACHGNVRQMDRIRLVHKMNMGFCVRCHREHHASRDCYVCHR